MEISREHHRQSLIGSAFIVVGAICFSAKSILIKLAYTDGAGVDAITLLTLRMLIALPFFLGVALWERGHRRQSHDAGDWLALLILGVIGYYLASLLDFKALEYIPAGLERLILFLYPTFVVILTAALYRRPIGRAQLAALLLSYAGILMVYGAQSQPDESSNIALGAGLVFGSALVFALFLTASGHFIPRFGSRRFTAYSMSIACFATITHFLATKPIEALLVPPRVAILALTLAVVSTVVPAFLMNAGIRRIGADQASIIGTLGPVSTLVLAFLVLGESLVPLQIIGSAMVLAGVVLVGLAKRPPPR